MVYIAGVNLPPDPPEINSVAWLILYIAGQAPPVPSIWSHVHLQQAA